MSRVLSIALTLKDAAGRTVDERTISSVPRGDPFALARVLNFRGAFFVMSSRQCAGNFERRTYTEAIAVRMDEQGAPN